MALPLATTAIVMVLGFATGSWRSVGAAITLCVSVAVALALGNGWHGTGWGEVGVAYNLLLAAFIIAAASAGVALRRIRRRDGTDIWGCP